MDTETSSLIIDDQTPICLSGGAIGADLQFGVCARMRNHLVVHFSFRNHRTDAPREDVVVLSPDQLESATEKVRTAGKRIKRNFPNDIFVLNLLRRNYFQIADTQRVYAVSHIDSDGFVDGGTAWATAMFMDRMEEEGMSADGMIHLFDQKLNKWLIYRDGRWVHEGEPPSPTNVYTGIGSRKLFPNGKAAIRKLLGVENMFSRG